jgi:hypothetical protein
MLLGSWAILLVLRGARCVGWRAFSCLLRWGIIGLLRGMSSWISVAQAFEIEHSHATPNLVRTRENVRDLEAAGACRDEGRGGRIRIRMRSRIRARQEMNKSTPHAGRRLHASIRSNILCQLVRRDGVPCCSTQVVACVRIRGGRF